MSSQTEEHTSTDPRREVGFRGEDLAAEHLCEQGWEILARNYDTKIGELDLVVRRFEQVYGRTEETLAFVEVKTRRTASGPPPEASVGRKKRQRLVRLAHFFLQKEKIRRVNVRFDVIGVDLSGDRPELTHFEAAFDADAMVC
jgi:putative endonuclease